MSLYNKHPALTKIQKGLFPYTDQMYPFEFKDYYFKLPVFVAGLPTIYVNATNYISGQVAANVKGRQAFLSAIKAYYNKNGWDPDVQSWIATDRDSATFYGHGLPEEISLVCQMALETKYKTEATLPAWVFEMLGIDCNGFVNAYYTSLGLFSRPLNDHPSYINVSRPAKIVGEIDCDSCMVTAIALNTEEQKVAKKAGSLYKVRKNPGNGAHILVIDYWEEKNKIFWATDQPGGVDGPRSSLYRIVEGPAADANMSANYVWKARLNSGASPGDDRLYSITRPMQSH